MNMSPVGPKSASLNYHSSHQPVGWFSHAATLSSQSSGHRPQQQSFVISLPICASGENGSSTVPSAAGGTPGQSLHERSESVASSGGTSSKLGELGYFVDESSCLLDARLSVAAKKDRKLLKRRFKRRMSIDNTERAATWLKKWLVYMVVLSAIVAVTSFFIKLNGPEEDMYTDNGIAYEWNELSESVFLVIPCNVVFFLGILSYFGFLFCVKSSKVLDTIEITSIFIPMLILGTPLMAFSLDTVICSGLSRVDVHVLQAFAIFGAAFLNHPKEAVFLLLLFRSAHCIEDAAKVRAMRAADAIETLAPTQAWVMDREALHSTTTVLVHTIPPILPLLNSTVDDATSPTIVGVSDIELLNALALRPRDVSTGKLVSVLSGLPGAAWVHAPVTGLEPGIIIKVKKGEIVPVKSTLLVGNAPVSVTQAHIDGETIPSPIAPGASVAAGSVVIKGYPVYLLVTHKETEGELAELRRVLKVADENKPPIEDFFGRIEKTYSKVIILIVVAIAIGFPSLPGAWAVPVWGSDGSLFRAMAFLVAGAPCALVLAAPIAYWSTATVYMQQSVSISEFSVIDSLASVTDVIFDKTGTLTTDIRVADFAEIDPHTLGLIPIISGTHLGRALSIVDGNNSSAVEGGSNHDDVHQLPDLKLSFLTLNDDISLLRAVAATATVEKNVNKQPHGMAASRWSESVLLHHNIALTKEFVGEGVPANTTTGMPNGRIEDMPNGRIEDVMHVDAAGAASDIAPTKPLAVLDVSGDSSIDSLDFNSGMHIDDVSSLNPDMRSFPVFIHSLEEDTSGRGISARMNIDGVNCDFIVGSAKFALELATHLSGEVIRKFLDDVDSQTYRGISVVALTCDDAPLGEEHSSAAAVQQDNTLSDSATAMLGIQPTAGDTSNVVTVGTSDEQIARQLQHSATEESSAASMRVEGSDHHLKSSAASSTRIFILAFKDTLRSGAAGTVKSLGDLGITVHIVSGDSFERTQAVAKDVGISTKRVIGGVSPEGKLKVVQSMRDAGKKVAMIGDESNDAAAMMASDVGMAIGEDASLVVMCVDVANVVLRPTNDVDSAGGYLDRVAFIIEHAIKCRWIVAENLVIALFGVLVVAPAAVMNKIPFVLAVLGHEGGTILVALNSLRLLSTS